VREPLTVPDGPLYLEFCGGRNDNARHSNQAMTGVGGLVAKASKRLDGRARSCGAAFNLAPSNDQSRLDQLGLVVASRLDARFRMGSTNSRNILHCIAGPAKEHSGFPVDHVVGALHVGAHLAELLGRNHRVVEALPGPRFLACPLKVDVLRVCTHDERLREVVQVSPASEYPDENDLPEVEAVLASDVFTRDHCRKRRNVACRNISHDARQL